MSGRRHKKLRQLAREATEKASSLAETKFMESVRASGLWDRICFACRVVFNVW